MFRPFMFIKTCLPLKYILAKFTRVFDAFVSSFFVNPYI